MALRFASVRCILELAPMQSGGYILAILAFDSTGRSV